MKILLVEPAFPIPAKSKNHKDFLPIGLLKIAAMHRAKGDKVKLIRGNKSKHEIATIGDEKWFVPDKIMITSLFTYWKSYVEDCIHYYDNLFPNAIIEVGGIYASLMPKDCAKIDGVDSVFEGIHEEAETCPPAYDLLETNPHPIDYQILHTSRGCPRECEFCGTWKIEPIFLPEKTIKDKIIKEKIVFYDNNLLMNPNINKILAELIKLKNQKKIKWCESQSGFDGRILLEQPELAKKIKKAGFKDVRIAWDGRYQSYSKIEKQLDFLTEAGYPSKEIYVFMLYNWDIEFEEMERKRIKCYEWGVQISDCRYRPLDRTNDNYNPRKFKTRQTNKDYHIHSKAGWTDAKVRQYRKNIREQNICVRHGFPFYSKAFEHKHYGREITRQIKNMNSLKEKIEHMKKLKIDYWIPNKIRYPKKENKK